MGVAGAVIGGALAGLAGAALLGRKNNNGADVGSMQQIDYQPTQAAAAAEVPIDVKATESGTTNNPLMEAEREKEKQAALLRERRNAEVLTSGLGASGVAATQKKDLLGG